MVEFTNGKKEFKLVFQQTFIIDYSRYLGKKGLLVSLQTVQVVSKGTLVDVILITQKLDLSFR